MTDAIRSATGGSPAESAEETYISIDIEAAGPIPGEFSMLALGACVVGNTDIGFYVELQPINDRYLGRALQVSGLSMAELQEKGTDPATAMTNFAQWIEGVTAPGTRHVYVAFNATFDWMFTHYYFVRFLGNDPFGVSGLDIKAFYMGLIGGSWADTSKTRIDPRFLPTRPHTHNALEDAVWQAEVFENLLAYRLERKSTRG